METIIRHGIFVVAAIMMMVVSGCSDELDGDETHLLKIEFSGAEGRSINHEYHVTMPAQGGDFNITIELPEMQTFNGDIECVFTDDKIYAICSDLNNTDSFSWDWGCFTKVAGVPSKRNAETKVFEREPFSYDIHIESNESGVERTVVFEIGNYPCYNRLTVIQK